LVRQALAAKPYDLTLAALYLRVPGAAMPNRCFAPGCTRAAPVPNALTGPKTATSTATARTPTLIVSDITMPVMDGFEV
jgi:CheY-like chemotaxis protein